MIFIHGEEQTHVNIGTPLENLSDADFCKYFEGAQRVLKEAQEVFGRYEWEALRRAKERGAKVIYDETFDCEIVETAQYDRTRLTPLLEELPDDLLEKCYTPEHPEIVSVPASWNMTQVKSAVAKLGGKARDILNAATLEPKRRATIARKEVKDDDTTASDSNDS